MAVIALPSSVAAIVAELPRSLVLSLTPIIFIGVLLVFTNVFTTIRYHLAQRRNASSTKPQLPAPLPYTLPFLGQALSWLAPQPGLFWHRIFNAYPDLRRSGTCTLQLANQRAHILFAPAAVQALFRAPLTRYQFNKKLLTTSLGLSEREAALFVGLDDDTIDPDTGLNAIQLQERMNHEYLLKPERVNELTKEFIRVLKDTLDGELKNEGEEVELDLYEWVRNRMFKASTDAFFGTNMMEMMGPQFEEDFYEFDRSFLTMFFGVPRLFAPNAFNVRDRLLDGLERWQKQMQENTNGVPADPDGDIDWEPNYGSRADRARQQYYAKRGLSLRARGGMDLGFLFGASSNAIPATGWMLMHIIDPNGDKTVLPRVMEELQTAKNPDGTVNIQTLIALPLVASIFHEILRLYVDVLVTREISHDTVLPLEEGKNPRQTLLKGGGVVMAPSFLGHRDAKVWSPPGMPPYDVFYADRFLKTDPETGKTVFSTAGSVGKLFPFGGGRTICPGRVFAKQEVLGSVAYMLLNFEFEVLKYVDVKGKTVNHFPGLREGFSGSGIMVMGGDVRVKMKRRR
ncbi:cytochrome P450 [Rhizodiscina lignyota]|uniref:Cytochrome P450 n=1 Tax=Rhizodiscina lignyota TaxID=1504668 RepID=A0A9P4ILJ8_9PEZI|nr:cytochrome P450 [Rhizodiscina lignyota]